MGFLEKKPALKQELFLLALGILLIFLPATLYISAPEAWEKEHSFGWAAFAAVISAIWAILVLYFFRRCFESKADPHSTKSQEEKIG